MPAAWKATVCGVAIGLLAVSQGNALTEAQSKAKVSEHAAAFWKGTGLPMPKGFSYNLTLVDLNGDGTAEALVVYSDPTSCGAKGCSAFVLDLSGPRACSLGDLIAFTLEPGSGKSKGWRDIVLDGSTVRFANGKYGKGSADC